MHNSNYIINMYIYKYMKKKKKKATSCNNMLLHIYEVSNNNIYIYPQSRPTPKPSNDH
jgi:hypothetical protein